MKKILFISAFIVLITTFSHARDCNSGQIKGDAFIYSDGKKVKVIKGDIPDPANKIIMIYNQGGWAVKQSGECKDFLPKQLGQLSGTIIKGKELVFML